MSKEELYSSRIKSLDSLPLMDQSSFQIIKDKMEHGAMECLWMRDKMEKRAIIEKQDGWDEIISCYILILIDIVWYFIYDR